MMSFPKAKDAVNTHACKCLTQKPPHDGKKEVNLHVHANSLFELLSFNCGLPLGPQGGVVVLVRDRAVGLWGSARRRQQYRVSR